MATRAFALAIVQTLLFGPATLAAEPDGLPPAASTTATQMTAAARALLAALSPEQATAASFVLDAEERSHWSNVPYQAHRRPGLKLGT